MRPYVKTVYSNLKSPKPGGLPWDIELDRHTLLVGTNTSHKSSVVQSVELSVAGSADDIFGRNAVSDAALLLTLAPGDELGVTGTLSDGSSTSFNIKREDGKVRRPQHNGPGSGALVHRAVSSALASSPAKARKAFLAWSGGRVSLDDVLAHLPVALHDKYREISEHKGRNNSVVETLLEIVSYAGQRQREASKEAKGAKIILDSIGETIEERPDDDNLTKMQIAVAEARKVFDVSVKAAGEGMTLADRDAGLAEQARLIEHLTNIVLSSERSIAEIESSLPTKDANVDHAIGIVDVAIKHNLEVCPVCSSHVGLAHLTNCQSFYKQKDNEWRSQSETKLSHIKKLESDIDAARRDIVVRETKVQRLQRVALLNVDGRVLPIADAQSRLEAATAALTSMEIAQSQWQNFARARDNMAAMEADVDAYRELKKACEIAVGKLLSEQAKTFNKRVNSYLPTHWEFSIELLDGEREVFRMGIMRDGKLHAALSGAEWASVVCAISMAVSEQVPETEPCVLIPEDRAWDGKTLAAVMRGFTKFKGQVLMASTIRPTGRTPKGWKIIDMDEMSASWCKPQVVDIVEVEPEQEPELTELNHASGGLKVTNRSTIMLSELGYKIPVIDMMSRETVASIIKDGLSPDNVRVQPDGSFEIVEGWNMVLIDQMIPETP